MYKKPRKRLFLPPVATRLCASHLVQPSCLCSMSVVGLAQTCPQCTLRRQRDLSPLLADKIKVIGLIFEVFTNFEKYIGTTENYPNVI